MLLVTSPSAIVHGTAVDAVPSHVLCMGEASERALLDHPEFKTPPSMSAWAER